MAMDVELQTVLNEAEDQTEDVPRCAGTEAGDNSLYRASFAKGNGSTPECLFFYPAN